MSKASDLQTPKKFAIAYLL